MRFVYLNFHSSFALELSTALIRSGSKFCACTVDRLHRSSELDNFIRTVSLSVVLDSTKAWQQSVSFADSTSYQYPDFNSAAFVSVRNSLSAWLLHRENYGMGLSEELLNFCITTALSNASNFLAYTRPNFVFSTFAPSTPFDIAVSQLCSFFDCRYFFLNDLPHEGLFYLTSSVDTHISPSLVPNIKATSDCITNCHNLAQQYLSSVLTSSPYYMPDGIIDSNISVSDSKARLQEFSDSISGSIIRNPIPDKYQPVVRFTSKLLRSFFFMSSRDMKFNLSFQHQKEFARARYLSSMKQLLVEPPASSPYILLLLDYYPEITRVPLGGPNYHWYNYFHIAFRIAEMFKTSDTKPLVLVKEHPAMLRATRHSYIRNTLIQFMKNYGIKFLSPFSKLTDFLVSSPPMCVVTGVSNAAVECSALSVPVLTPSHPWWLSLPNTYHVNPFLPIHLSNKLDSHSLQTTYALFLHKYSFDLAHPMDTLDTSEASFQDKAAAIESIVISLLSYCSS